MARDINPIALAALGLLVERPMHPYEMYQLLIDRSEDRLIKVRPGTLYHAVGRLTTDGLVRPIGTEREGNRPERTTYEITDAGRTTLTAALRTMLATPEPEYPQFPLALAESHNLPRDEVVELLRRRIELLRKELADYDTGISPARARGVPVRYWVDATYQRTLRSTEIDWLENFVDEVADGTLSWDDVAHDKPAHHLAGHRQAPHLVPNPEHPHRESSGT